MLFAIDVGNTNTVLGIFDGDLLVTGWRIRTEKNNTEDEFNLLVKSLLRDKGVDPSVITETIISCVVPPVMNILDGFCRKYLGHPPVWVDFKTVSTLMPIRCPNPAEVGADRIVNGVAAFDKYKRAMIVVDFGTATTFDVISESGEYVGGAITPGIMISAEALFSRTSKLPKVELFEKPEHVIGRDTASCLKSGIIYGYAGLVDGLVKRIQDESDSELMVIGTGGLSELMFKVAESIEVVEPSLTLEGLKVISRNLRK